MQTLIRVYNPKFGKHVQIKARRVVYDVIAHNSLPSCAWCHITALLPLTDIIQRGFTLDLVQTVGYCETCNKATIVEYELAHEVETEV